MKTLSEQLAEELKDADGRDIVLGALYINTEHQAFRLVRPWKWFAHYGGGNENALKCEVVWPVTEDRSYYDAYPSFLKRADIVEVGIRVQELTAAAHMLADELSTNSIPSEPGHRDPWECAEEDVTKEDFP